MEDFKKYWPIIMIALVAITATAVAGWQSVANPDLFGKDLAGADFWYLPLFYLFLTWVIVGTKKLNRPLVALGAIVVYTLSVLLLFAPALPPGLEWHYPIAIAYVLYAIFS